MYTAFENCLRFQKAYTILARHKPDDQNSVGNAQEVWKELKAALEDDITLDAQI